MTMNTNSKRTPGDWAVIETDDGLTINTVRDTTQTRKPFV
jgi:hypothetical protein